MIVNSISFRICIILLLMIATVGEVTCKEYSGVPFVKVYLPKEYNAGMQNNDLTQDQRGFIYIANNYGLLEYDGTNWRVYSTSNGTKVRSVAIHPSGRIYVGAQNQFGYFFPDQNGLLIYHSISDLLPSDQQNVGEVWKTFIIKNDIYFSLQNSIYHYDGKELIKIDPRNTIENTFLVNNQIYVDIAQTGISIIKDNKLIPMRGSELFQTKLMTGLVPFTAGKLLASSKLDGLFIYDGSTFEKWSVPANLPLSQVIINTLIQLSTDEIAVGTSSDGLYILSPNGTVKYLFDKNKGFNNRDINAMMEDCYGSLWVGQNNGLARIETSSPFTYINEQNGLQGAGYSSFIFKNQLYLGTNNGLYRDKENQKDLISEFELIPSSEGQVYSITLLDGHFLIGHDDGAKIMKNGQTFPISKEPGAWKFLIPHNNPNLLLEGNYYGFLYYFKQGDEWIYQGKVEGLTESSRVFEEQLDGTIWMTHGYKGVYKLIPSADGSKFESIQFYDQNDGFATNQLINVFRINNELIFCSGKGIYQYNQTQDRFELHEKLTKIFGSDIHIRSMEEDAFGNVYFIAAGFSGVLLKDRFGDYQMETQIFNKIHDQLNDDLEDISAIDFNLVLFGAHQGFIQYDTKKQTQLLKPINIFIRKIISTNKDSVIFNGSFVDVDRIGLHQSNQLKIEFPYEQNSISFHFSSTFPDDESKTKYSYKLNGYDKNWSEWSTSTEKEYTNLKEGKYEFEVRAKNIYNVESELTSYRFYVLPPWYRTKIAFFSYVLLVGLMLTAILMSQSLRHKREKKVLTLKQKRELIRKDNEIVEMSEKSNAEIIKLKNEKLELDINSKNKELASTTMNLIDKNQLLTGLKNDLRQILDEDKRNSSNKSLREMIKKIDRSIGHDDEWEHFQQYFDQVHGDFTFRLRAEFSNLSPQEIKLSNYLRMNLSTKEIAQLMNITTRGVEIGRYRLRKKLGIERETNLTEFIGRF